MLPKAKAIRPEVPAIMVTAYGDPDTRRKALENGATGLLTKPIDFALLRLEIDTLAGAGGLIPYSAISSCDAAEGPASGRSSIAIRQSAAVVISAVAAPKT
jgi:CheY-like chemotaxis protein